MQATRRHDPPVHDSTVAGELLGRRLRRARGQVSGIERMVAEGRSCEHVLIQLAAVQGALQATAQQLFEGHVDALTAAVARGTLPASSAAADTARLARLLTHIGGPTHAPDE